MRKYLGLGALSLSLLTVFGVGLAGFAEPEKTEKSDKTEKVISARPHMDLAFCIDTTGSMQNEIDSVKSKVKALVAKLAEGKPAPVVRVGMVAFRDRGDQYVTKVFQFTEDIDKFVKDVADLKADGGGDGPEAVNQGLHAAVNDLSWSKEEKTAKLVFLIGDAPPHQYAGDFKWDTEAKAAISRGIQINTISCAGLESYPQKDGIEVWQQIAKLSDGKYEALTYHKEVMTASGEKETMVSAGGTTYRVKGARGADWRKGVASLAAEGAVDKMTAAPMARPSGIAMPMSFAAVGMGFGGADGAKAVGRSASLSRAKTEVSSYGAADSIGRGDSNLEDIVLGAARERAAKLLKVDYSKTK